MRSIKHRVERLEHSSNGGKTELHTIEPGQSIEDRKAELEAEGTQFDTRATHVFLETVTV